MNTNNIIMYSWINKKNTDNFCLKKKKCLIYFYGSGSS